MKLPPASFVLPCLNEAPSLPQVLRAIESLRGRFEDLDVVLVDNGSEDESAAIARSLGARVVTCDEKGYGASLRVGIAEARHDIVVMADSDGTYDWNESIRFVLELRDGSGHLIVGNRLKGRRQPGAMPFLHRWIGTPVLSAVLTLMHGWRRGVRVGDCNGGLRAFRKSDFLKWNPRSQGMEFASEMIVLALKAGAVYREIPVDYRKSYPGRRSHLRPWQDSLRHLRTILSN